MRLKILVQILFIIEIGVLMISMALALQWMRIQVILMDRLKWSN